MLFWLQQRRFCRCGDTIAAFMQFWSPVTNSFHLPCGEMSISFLDLRILRGLPIQGEPVDEYTPTNAEFALMDLPRRLFDIWSRVTIHGKCDYSYWAHLFGRISDPASRREPYPAAPEVGILWLPQEEQESIQADEERRTIPDAVAFSRGISFILLG